MQFDSLIINANALLDLTNLVTTPNSTIGIKDGIISLIKHDTSFNQYNYTNLIDLKGALLTPGLIDCHTHLIFAGNRANEFKMRLDGISYSEIAKAGGGIKSTVNATNLATEDELLNLALKRVKVMQNNGTTTIEVKSGYSLSVDGEIKILEVAKKLGQQSKVDIIPTFLGAHAIPSQYANNSDLYIDLIIDKMLPLIKERNLANAVDAFCENIAFNPAQVERLFECATKLGFRVKLHAEQLSDQKATVLACRYDALSVDHLEYLDPVDITNFNKTVAVLLPGAFYFLKETKLPPVKQLRQAHVPIAIATDLNPGTSPFMSLPLIMNMACIYFNLTIAEAWQGVTINAAKALGLGDKIGSITVGKQADFAVWDCNNPETIVYNPTANLCLNIIKDGRLIN